MRRTRQRDAVIAALETGDEFRSAQQLYDDLRASGVAVGLATVYRTLAAMTAAGEVDILRNADGEATYRRCSTTEHHHHLVCRRCGSVAEIANPAVESWTVEVARLHGFADVDHRLTVTGVCPACRSVHQRVEGAGTS